MKKLEITRGRCLGPQKMSELKEHGRLIRQFLKAARELQALGVIDNIESKSWLNFRMSL